MIVTTTPNLEGRTIAEYRGIVTGEAILGANLFKDLGSGSDGLSYADEAPLSGAGTCPPDRHRGDGGGGDRHGS